MVVFFFLSNLYPCNDQSPSNITEQKCCHLPLDTGYPRLIYLPNTIIQVN